MSGEKRQMRPDPSTDASMTQSSPVGGWRRTTRAAALAVALATAVLAAACTLPPYTGPARRNVVLRSENVAVSIVNDDFFNGTSDEPYDVKVWFRVKLGVAGSASTGYQRGPAIYSLYLGQNHDHTTAESNAVTFPQVQLLDLWDVLNARGDLEIVGSYTWAMEEDNHSVDYVASSTANILRAALEQTVAAASIPEDPAELISIITDNLGDAFTILGGNLAGLSFGTQDDQLGGRLYIGLGVTGTLAALANEALAGFEFPAIEIPILDVPPNILGGRIVTLDRSTTFEDQNFDQDGWHIYRFSMGSSG